MKAILHTQYGAPDLLQLTEVDKPAPRENEVLIAIHATTVSTGDCNMRARGEDQRLAGAGGAAAFYTGRPESDACVAPNLGRQAGPNRRK